MTAKSLTARFVEHAKPHAEKRLEISDATTTGLYLVIQPSGKKSWAFRYRFAGKPRKLTLGAWPACSLADAREAAVKASDLVAHGTDPGAVQKAKKAAALDAQLEDRDRVSALIEQFDRRHLSQLKSGAAARRFLDRFVEPAWGERKIQSITRRDVIDLLDEICDSGRMTTANRVRAHMSKFFSWCVERDIIATSPVTGVKPPAREQARDRVLSDDEIRLFWRACLEIGAPWGDLGRFLLLTGQRLNEAARMTRDEIEGDLWRLPAERVKNGRAHDVPLSGAALEIIAESDLRFEECPYVFSTNGFTPVAGFDKGKTRIAEEMRKQADGEGIEIAAWTFHDLRRTAATGLARLGTSVRITEAVLNHISGSAAGIVSVYQRHDYADEKRHALEAWDSHVALLTSGELDNNRIVTLDRSVNASYR